MAEILVPIFAIVFLFGVPVAAWIISRVLAHQERMEMIRRGIVPPSDPRLFRDMQRRGWQAGPIPPPPGPGLGAVPPTPPPNMYDEQFYAQSQLRKGITVTMVGFALLIGLSFIGFRGDGRMEFGPWLLGGLIPMFVGIAQIINALLNGARFPGMQSAGGPATQSPFTAQPPPAGGMPPNPPPPQSSGPYGWRPGPTPEIEKPAQPPDAR
jgi:hypothetical protein